MKVKVTFKDENGEIFSHVVPDNFALKLDSPLEITEVEIRVVEDDYIDPDTEDVEFIADFGDPDGDLH